MNASTFHGHGKLLLTGEYAVLDGATALALPTRRGQSLTVDTAATEGPLEWTGLDHQGQPWFTAFLEPGSWRILRTDKEPVAKTLAGLLAEADRQVAGFTDRAAGCRVTTRLDFPRDWGLGSSSTLIATLAEWSGADPYDLLWAAFGGSGYDVACAVADGPLTYRIRTVAEAQDTDTGSSRVAVERIPFDPVFADRLTFVHLNAKQDSREAITAYRERGRRTRGMVERIDHLTRRTREAAELAEFEEVLREHEAYVGHLIGTEPIGPRLFPDFPGGVVKSLGAWGGDFLLATGEPESVKRYFAKKGYPVQLSYRDIIL